MHSKSPIFCVFISLFFSIIAIGQDSISNELILFEIGKITTAQNSTVRIPISVKNFEAISGFQYSIHLADTTAACFTGVENFNLTGLSESSFSVENGIITCVWLDNNLTGITLPDSTVIYELVLRTKEGLPACTNIQMRDEPTDFVVIQIVDNDAIKVPFTSIAGEICTDQNTSSYHLLPTLGTIRPNPTDNHLLLDFDLPQATKLKLQLTSILGKQTHVYFAKKPYASGPHQLTISLADLPAGTYLMQMQTSRGLWTEKVVKLDSY